MIVVAAALAPLMIGAGAFTVDLNMAYRTQGALQTAADAAALGAAMKLPSEANARALALDLAAKNTPSGLGQVTKAADVVIGTYNKETKAFTPSSTNVNAVRVYAKRTAANGNASPSYLGKIFGLNNPDLQAVATAVRVGPAACVIALKSSGNNAFNVSGNGKFSVPNCPVWVNSSHTNGANVGNSAIAEAQSFCVVGSYSGSFSPTPKTGCAPIDDPLSTLPEPSPGPCIWNYNNGGMNANVFPGTYCGSFSANAGSVTFGPGNYYFKDANVSISSGTSLQGAGVFLFFDKDSAINHGA